MARVDAKGFQEKHARRLKASLEDIRKGVEGVSEAPTKKAAAKVDKMRAGILRALDDGKWQRRLESVTLEDWKTKTIEKGINRIPEGIDKAADKVEKFAAELLPYIDSGVAMVNKLPDVTLEDSIQRATTFIRHMSKFKRRG